MFEKKVSIATLAVSIVVLLLSIAGGYPGMFTWGKSVAEAECAPKTERMALQHEQQIKYLKKEHEDTLAGLNLRHEQHSADLTGRHQKQIDEMQRQHKQEIADLRAQLPPSTEHGPETLRNVFAAGHFANGLQMGLNTSNGRTDWVTRIEDSIRIAYPGGAQWGAWFITIGAPVAQKADRSFMDASAYSKLSLELRGKQGDKVAVALKDVHDPDDGTESRYSLTLRSNDWETYEIDLKEFRTADLKRLYVAASFVFARQPQTIFVRKIQFE